MLVIPRDVGGMHFGFGKGWTWETCGRVKLVLELFCMPEMSAILS